MKRFPQMDLMMAETLVHAEQNGLLDTIDLEVRDGSSETIVPGGVVVSEEKSTEDAKCEDTSLN